MKATGTQSVEVDLSDDEVKKIVRHYIESKTKWRFPYMSGRCYGTRISGDKVVIDADRFSDYGDEFEYTEFYQALVIVIEELGL
jgi:hypothetical protein